MNTEETTRQLKVGRLIQKEVSSLYMKECSNLVSGAIVTVTKVRVSPDLSYAKVYLSVFPFNKSDIIMEKMQNASKQIRLHLGKKVKTQLRIVPELAFFLDDTMEYIENIDNLLKEE